MQRSAAITAPVPVQGWGGGGIALDRGRSLSFIHQLSGDRRTDTNLHPTARDAEVATSLSS